MRAPPLAFASILAVLAACLMWPGTARASTVLTSIAVDHASTSGDEVGPGDVVHVTLQRAPSDKGPYDAFWGDFRLPVAPEIASGTDVLTFSIPSSASTDGEAWAAIRARQRRQPLAPLTVASADGGRSASQVSLRLYLPAVIRSVVVRNGAGRAAALGDTLEVSLDEGALKMLRQRPSVVRSPLGLFVSGRFLGGNIVDGVAADTVTVTLDRRDDNRASWQPILDGRAHFWNEFESPIALGTSDASEQTTVFRIVVSPWGNRPLWALLLLGVVVASAMVLLLRTDLARDVIHPQTGRAPYSLGRTQLFVWVSSVMLAAVAVWLETGDKTIPGGLLVALGIGGGTTLGSRVIDKSLWAEALATHQQTIKDALAAARGAANASEIKKLEQELKDAVEHHIHPQAPASENFLRDILTGLEGDALYRYQLVGWTLFIMVQFWVSVLSRVELPDLDSTRLALMGMSAGTYLGLKMPEKPAI
jgi:hypothetical protein